MGQSGASFRARGPEWEDEQPKAESPNEPNQELASAYCPHCSARLEQRSCKMICPTCGYYMSCSDFY